MTAHSARVTRKLARFAAAFSFAAIATMSIVPATAAVFGKDDRVSVPPQYETIAARVGLLFNNRTQTVCSAFCVAENVIATAAHCIARGQPKNAVRFEDFTFARNFDRTNDLSKIEGIASNSAPQNIVTGDFKLRVRPPIDAVHDWAIIKLQRKGCSAGGLPVQALPFEELAAESVAGKIFQISYHRDWARWRPAYSKPCAVARNFDSVTWPMISPDFLNPEKMILHTCDTGGASSGSPLLLDGPDGPVVIGINVGTYVQSKIVTQSGQVTMRQTSETVANTAVSAQVFAGQVQAMRNAIVLPSGRPIRDLQERLKLLGYYSGPIDTVYGPTLKSAIEAYEAAANLPVTGLASRQLLSRMVEEAARGGAVTPSSGLKMPR